MQAEENLKRISKETAEYKKILDKSQQGCNSAQPEVAQHNQGLLKFVFCSNICKHLCLEFNIFPQ